MMVWGVGIDTIDFSERFHVELQQSKSNLASLLEQTGFLLEKHKESRATCLSAFASLNALIERELAIRRAASKKVDAEQLELVQSLIKKQLETFEHDVSDDIAFLEEQYAGIEEAMTHEAPEDQAELFKALMGDESLVSTEEFKKMVSEEATAAYESFIAIINDLKDVLADGEIDELLLYVQNMQQDDEENEDEDSDGCDDDEDSCCDSDEKKSGSCSSSSKASKQECCKGKDDCGKNCVCDSDCGCE